MWVMILPYLATTSGWLMTELGRYPWVVFGLMKIETAISPTVSAGEVLLSLVVFTLVYGALAAADIYLLAKYARLAPEAVGEQEEVREAIPSLVGAQD
jgi:cytochrome d ubiquinol oxidase subunit I